MSSMSETVASWFWILTMTEDTSIDVASEKGQEYQAVRIFGKDNAAKARYCCPLPIM
jgi:hypothetical protein